MIETDKYIREGNFAKAVGTVALATQAAFAPPGVPAAEAEPVKIEQMIGSDIDMEIIKHIESTGRAWVTGKAGEVGLFQLSPASVIAEWNNYHPNEQYEPKELYDAKLNRKVAEWYMLKRIPQMLRHFGVKDTVKNRIIAYNAGIEYLRLRKPLPQITINYLRKYERLRRK